MLIIKIKKTVNLKKSFLKIIYKKQVFFGFLKNGITASHPQWQWSTVTPRVESKANGRAPVGCEKNSTNPFVSKEILHKILLSLIWKSW